MKAPDRKLLRDLARCWEPGADDRAGGGQRHRRLHHHAVGGGVAGAGARRLLRRCAFAEVFAGLGTRAPALVERCAAQSRRRRVQTTVEQMVRVETRADADRPADRARSARCRRPHGLLNRVTLAGVPAMLARWCGGGAGGDGSLEALVSEGFALKRGLKPGPAQRAGQRPRRELVVVGIALSPEFVFFAGLGACPTSGFGVFWMDREALAAAYDLAAPSTASPWPRAGRRKKAHRPLAQPRAGAERHVGATTRPRTSHARQRDQGAAGDGHRCCRRSSSAWRPSCSTWWCRAVATQREQIAALKALGYATATSPRTTSRWSADRRRAGCWAWRWANSWACCSSGCTPSSSASRCSSTGGPGAAGQHSPSPRRPRWSARSTPSRGGAAGPGRGDAPAAPGATAHLARAAGLTRPSARAAHDPARRSGGAALAQRAVGRRRGGLGGHRGAGQLLPRCHRGGVDATFNRRCATTWCGVDGRARRRRARWPEARGCPA